jgi:hypothetical protein
MFPADDPQVRLIKALQLVDCCGNADEDHSDDDRGEGGVGHYAATISSRATFLQVVELVKNGQLAAQYLRIFAASGL